MSVTKKKKLSVISVFHYWKLAFRSALFVWAALTYLLHPEYHGIGFTAGFREFRLLLFVVWGVFALEMILRFFPSDTESMGCQKQFRKNYRPSGADASAQKLRTRNGTITVAVSWLILNGVIGTLYLLGIIDDAGMLLVALFYSVSDMICILFFCPFQSWMLHNRCCTVCRIYNWDYLMMFTPFLFIPSFYTWSLGAMALTLFIRWELTVKKHPEYFSEACNESLRCVNCQEKLCVHKKQLIRLWSKERAHLEKDRAALEERLDEIYQSLGRPREQK